MYTKKGKLIIEVGFTFGGDSGDKGTPQEELDALKRSLNSNWVDPRVAPEKPTRRDEITLNIFNFFNEINEDEKFKSLVPYYHFYHVLEDPDDE